MKINYFLGDVTDDRWHSGQKMNHWSCRMHTCTPATQLLQPAHLSRSHTFSTLAQAMPFPPHRLSTESSSSSSPRPRSVRTCAFRDAPSVFGDEQGARTCTSRGWNAPVQSQLAGRPLTNSSSGDGAQQYSTHGVCPEVSESPCCYVSTSCTMDGAFYSPAHSYLRMCLAVGRNQTFEIKHSLFFGTSCYL